MFSSSSRTEVEMNNTTGELPTHTECVGINTDSMMATTVGPATTTGKIHATDNCKNGPMGMTKEDLEVNITMQPNPNTHTKQDPLLLELQQVYDNLSVHRKDVTKLMANVKRCYVKVLKRLERSEHQEPNTATLRTKQITRGGGLTKPFPVSTSLCAFMDVPQGTQLARAEVTQYLHKYIRDNNLYDNSNRQYIIPDSSLKSLFNISDDTNEKMHIFSMQKKMNTHFKYTNTSVENSGA